MRFLTSSFIHDSNPSGPLIKMLKFFELGLNFAEIFKFKKKVCGVHPTAGSSSRVCIILRGQVIKVLKKLRGVKLRGVHHTTKSDSAVCITPKTGNLLIRSSQILLICSFRSNQMSHCEQLAQIAQDK